MVTWTLTITDNTSGDIGSVSATSLTLVPARRQRSPYAPTPNAAPATVTFASGAATIADTLWRRRRNRRRPSPVNGCAISGVTVGSVAARWLGSICRLWVRPPCAEHRTDLRRHQADNGFASLREDPLAAPRPLPASWLTCRRPTSRRRCPSPNAAPATVAFAQRHGHDRGDTSAGSTSRRWRHERRPRSAGAFDQWHQRPGSLARWRASICRFGGSTTIAVEHRPDLQTADQDGFACGGPRLCRSRCRAGADLPGRQHRCVRLHASGQVGRSPDRCGTTIGTTGTLTVAASERCRQR